MHVELSTLDRFIVVAYIAIMVGVGLIAVFKNKNADDYYVGGRRVGTFTLGCLWMASWIGGAIVVGSVDEAFNLGVTSIWYCGSMAVGCIIFAYTSTGIIQKTGHKLSCITYPELIEYRYGPSSRIISTITTFLAYIAYTAGQFLAMAKLLTVFLGWDLSLSLWVSAASMIVYTALGGFIAVAITGVSQALAILLTLSFIMVPVMFFSVKHADALYTLPSSYFNLGAWGPEKIIGLFVTITLTFFTSMDSYTRCFAAKTQKVAKNGTLIAAVMVMIIALTTTYIGISGKELLGDYKIPNGGSVISILIAEYMPVGVKGIVLIGLLAAIMSTGSVCLLVASANITQDIYKRFICPSASSLKILILGGLSTIAVGVFACYLALLHQNIIDILYIAFTINSAGLFIPTIAAFLWKRGNALTATLSMAASLSVVVVWYIVKMYNPSLSLFQIDPVWPGLATSALVFLTGAYLFPLNDKETKAANFFSDNQAVKPNSPTT